MDSHEYAGTELELFRGASNWKAYFHNLLGPYLSGDVLEVGAGLGATTRVLCDGLQASWFALEPDPALAAQVDAEHRERPFAAPFELLTGTVESLSRERSFDTVLYVDVLEHIEDDRAELSVASRHLRPGGRLIVLAPACTLLYSAFDAHIGHFRRYSKRTLAQVVPSQLEEEACLYVDSVGMLASVANRLLLRASLPTKRQVAFWDRTLVPLSRKIDPILRFRLGKTVVGVWRRPLPDRQSSHENRSQMT